jgi:hypothetical protein
MLLALLLDTGVLLASLLSCGTATAPVVHLVARRVRTGYTRLRFWQAVAVMTNPALVTAAAHSTRITPWAAVFIPRHGA